MLYIKNSIKVLTSTSEIITGLLEIDLSNRWEWRVSQALNALQDYKCCQSAMKQLKHAI